MEEQAQGDQGRTQNIRETNDRKRKGVWKTIELCIDQDQKTWTE